MLYCNSSMLKLFSLFLSSTILLTTWITTDIGNNLFIDFPNKPTISNLEEGHTLHFSTAINCNFFVDIDQIPEITLICSRPLNL